MKLKIIIPIFLFVLQYLWVFMFFLISLMSWMIMTFFKILGKPRMVPVDQESKRESAQAIAI